MDENHKTDVSKSKNIHMCTPQWTHNSHKTHTHKTITALTMTISTVTVTAHTQQTQQQPLPHEHHTYPHAHLRNHGANTRSQRENGIKDSADLFTSDTLKGGAKEAVFCCLLRFSLTILSSVGAEQSHMFMQACHGKWCFFPFFLLR